jgi:hypothetical protein
MLRLIKASPDRPAMMEEGRLHLNKIEKSPKSGQLRITEIGECLKFDFAIDNAK